MNKILPIITLLLAYNSVIGQKLGEEIIYQGSTYRFYPKNDKWYDKDLSHLSWEIDKVHEGISSENKDGTWVSFHENELKLVRIKFSIKNGKRSGTWTRYYENGQIYSEITYKDGKKEGQSNFWHEDGSKFMEAYYLNDLQDGEFYSWGRNGNLQTYHHYDKGRKDQSCIEYHSNGNKMSEDNFTSGIRNGNFSKWYENGQLKYTIRYENGFLVDSLYSFYYENGQKRIESRISTKFLRDSEFPPINFIGHMKEWYPNGNKKAEGDLLLNYYTDCCTGGLCKIFYSTRSDKWKFWYFDGQLMAKGNFSSKKEHIDTRCGGGDDFMREEMTGRWKFFNKIGKKTDRDSVIKNDIFNPIKYDYYF